jgi:hypothetical protein
MLDGIAKTDGLITQAEGGAAGAVFAFRGAPVGWSKDLDRVAALPRRPLNPDDPAAAIAWTAHLKRDNEKCDCDRRWGIPGTPGTGCIKSLKPIQGWSLEEASDVAGLFGNIGVGFGKTGISILLPMAIPDVKRAILLIPPRVKRQFFEKDYPQWSAHFKVPNLADYGTFIDGRPTLVVITYSELSLPKNSDILTRYGMPDLIIADESHNLKNHKGPRWRRVERAFEAGCNRFVAISGSPTDRSIKEFSHTMERCLDDQSPTPLHPPTVDAWAAALDAGEYRAPMGLLANFCNPGENVQAGFARRVADTHGVIVTTGSSVRCGLEITAIKAPPVPKDPLPGFDGRNLQDLIEATRNGQRPDGDESQDALTAAMWARQLAAGFYSYWNFPRGEPDTLIKDWFAKRKLYNKEVREKLKYSREFLDQPLNLWNAAVRWHDGYTHEGVRVPPKAKNGPMPSWPSEHFAAWRDIKDQVFHETRYKWVSEYLVDAAADWGRKNLGIIWFEHHDFGAKVAERLGLPLYDGGKKSPELDERGDRTIVCSIKANNTGTNLQKWSDNLVTTPPSTNKDWEQMLGRTHRDGQRADVVTAEVFLHTPEMRRAFDMAQMRARYVTHTMKNPQKLSYATIDLTHAIEDKLRKPVSTDNRWWENLE